MDEKVLWNINKVQLPFSDSFVTIKVENKTWVREHEPVEFDVLYDAIKANVTFHFRIHAPTTVKMSFKDTYQFEKAFNGIFPKY